MDKIKILNDFLPDKIFDAHMHLCDESFYPRAEKVQLEDYYEFVKPIFCNRQVLVNAIPKPALKTLDNKADYVKFADDFIYNELSKNSANVGELLVLPNESRESILSRINGKQICGFKPYHALYPAQKTMNLDIKDYLPESAFEIANEYNKVITLHLVKDASLSDPENLNYIMTMAKRYPNSILILAHAARAFAGWTGFETVEKLKDFDNIFFDLSAICEVPQMFQIIKKCGLSRVMWGSDFPISKMKGKAISLADKFYWIYDFEHPEITKDIELWSIFEENLMAVRQTALMLDLSQKQKEDLFYNNAKSLLTNK